MNYIGGSLATGGAGHFVLDPRSDTFLLQLCC